MERDLAELLRHDDGRLIDEPISTVIDLVTLGIGRAEQPVCREEMSVLNRYRTLARVLGVFQLVRA
jgi:hypothetical protein